MRIETSRLGTIEIEESSIITLPSGLIGLPELSRFVVLEFGEGIPLGWLQSVENADFGLPVADPGLYVADYEVELPRGEVAELELSSTEDAVFLIVTTIHAGGTQITGNLRAPVLVNVRNRRARQVVLDRPELDFRTPVDPLLFAHAIGLEEKLAMAAPAQLTHQPA